MIPGLKKRVFNFHDLLMYLALGRKHLRLMVLLMCLMLLVGLVWYVFARPVYQARAMVRLEYVQQPMDTDKLYHDGRQGWVIRELMSPYIMERTAKALGVPGNAKTIQTMYVFKERAAVTTEKNLEIEVWPNSAALARRWPEELVKQYLAYREEKRRHDRDLVVETFIKEMKEVRGKIDDTSKDRYVQHEQSDVTRTEIDASRLRDIPVELVLLSKNIDDVGRVRVKLDDPTLDVVAKLSLIASLDDRSTSLTVGQDVRVDPPPTVPDEIEKEGPAPEATQAPPQKSETIVTPPMLKSVQPWEDLEKQAQQLKSMIGELSVTYKPGHAKMVALNKQLDEVNRRLGVELQVAANRLGLQYQELLNKRTDLEAKLPEYEQINQKMANITRDSKIYEASQLPWNRYLSDMQKRLEALDYANDKERVDLDYVGLTYVSDTAVSPSRGKIALVAVFLGLVLALGVPFLIEYLDHTLTNLEQVESTFQLRGLGIVPKLEDQNISGTVLLNRRKTSEGNLVENFRVIRTNLLSMGAITKAPHVIMVTSAMPKEGKTVVSSNLAISFSQTGSRTLLMDTDLRRGRLHRLFGYRKSPGLSDVLAGECTLAEACRLTVHDNLTILSAGKHLDTGTELLGSERFSEIMKELRGKYDRIVVDTPPVLGLSETSILQTYMDGVLFVIWSGNTPIRTMQAAIEMLQANGALFYGFVLNRLDLNATTNYYQYYYYSHDYYYHTTHTLENA